MCSKRDIVIFLAGAMAFHTISHIFLAYMGLLPLVVWSINLTVQLNRYIVAASGIITLALLWWAHKLK